MRISTHDVGNDATQSMKTLSHIRWFAEQQISVTIAKAKHDRWLKGLYFLSESYLILRVFA